MDQGVAAIWAGLVGAGGALAGAIAGLWGARLSAAKAVEAARLQVRDQSHAEHRHWVREQRQQAYTGTSRLYVEVLHALRNCAEALKNGREGAAADLLPAARRAVTDLQIAVFDLRLWGPPDIVSTAKDLRRSANHALDTLSEWHDAVLSHQDWEDLQHVHEQAMNGLGDPYADFMRIAANTLGAPAVS